MRDPNAGLNNLMHFTVVLDVHNKQWILQRGHKTWLISFDNSYTLMHLINNMSRVSIDKTILSPFGVDIHFTLARNSKVHPVLVESLPHFQNKTLVKPRKGRIHFKD